MERRAAAGSIGRLKRDRGQSHHGRHIDPHARRVPTTVSGSCSYAQVCVQQWGSQGIRMAPERQLQTPTAPNILKEREPKKIL